MSKAATIPSFHLSNETRLLSADPRPSFADLPSIKLSETRPTSDCANASNFGFESKLAPACRIV